MFLAIDIGNTRIKSALFEDNDIHEINSFTDVGSLLNYSSTKKNILDIAISSVVPSTANSLSEHLNKYLRVEPFIINSNSKFSLKNEYKSPNTLGIDRLCSAEGAFFLFKQSQKFKNYSDKDFIITIDFGTATTINFVRYPGVFLGGIIAPGVKTMFDSLRTNTAQLPEVNLKDFNNFIGSDTKESIASGVLNSTLGLIEKAITNLKQDYQAKNIFIYITGGNADEILKYVKFDYIFEESLVLLGIKAVWELNKN